MDYNRGIRITRRGKNIRDFLVFEGLGFDSSFFLLVVVTGTPSHQTRINLLGLIPAHWNRETTIPHHAQDMTVALCLCSLHRFRLAGQEWLQRLRLGCQDRVRTTTFPTLDQIRNSCPNHLLETITRILMTLPPLVNDTFHPRRLMTLQQLRLGRTMVLRHVVYLVLNRIPV